MSQDCSECGLPLPRCICDKEDACWKCGVVGCDGSCEDEAKELDFEHEDQ